MIRRLAVLGAVLTCLVACDSSQVGTAPRPSRDLPPSVTASPTRTPVAHDPRAVIDGPHATAFQVRYDGRGDVLALWASDDRNDGPRAIAIRTHDGRLHLLAAPSSATVVSVLPEGWIESDGHRAWLVSTGGAVTGLRVGASTISSRAGDVAVPLSRRFPVVFRPTDGLLHRLPASGVLVTAFAVTPSGRSFCVGCLRHRRGLLRLRRGRWRPVAVDLGHGGIGGPITGAGLHLVTYTEYDTTPNRDGGPLPVGRLVLSDDSGASWHTVLPPRRGVGPFELGSLSETASGTVILEQYLVGGHTRLVRFRPSRRPDTLPGPFGTDVFAHGDRFYRLIGGHSPTRLEVSSDGGDTWHRLAIPGRS